VYKTLTVFAAGSDTVSISRKVCTFLAESHDSAKTVASMCSLFLALVLYPHVQQRAQAELDAVVGRDRLPTFEDRPRLPFIEAICKELMRWQMVTPIGSSFHAHGTD
jgi:cytochrome P450